MAGQAQNIGFAISIDQAKQALNDLENGQTPTHPFLGVQTVDLTATLQHQLGLSVDHGALVVAVTPDSGTATAGIQQGDVILRFASSDIMTADDLARAVADAKPDSNVDVVFQRRSAQATATVEIGQRPASRQ